MIADQSGFKLLAARVHHGDNVHLFVSAPPKVCIPKMVGVFKCVSAKMLFKSFPGLSCSFGVAFVVGGLCRQDCRRRD